MKNKKLNIAFIDLDDVKNPILAGGQATATKEVGKRLVANGHSVTVYCSRYPGYQDRIEDGISYQHIGLGTSNIKINNALFFMFAPMAVRKIKNKDVIIECFTAPASTLLSPLFTKIPVIALPSMFNAIEFYKKYHVPFHWIEKMGMKSYKYMLPYSEVDSAKAVRLNPKIKYKVVHQGVDDKYIQIKKTEPKHILFLSRFDIAQKGIDLLLQSYAKVKNQIKYPLVLAGHGPDEPRIKELIKELKLEDKVRLVGSAYGDKKMKLMAESLYVVFPSRHDEMCLWALEALAGGLPLIGFDLPESRWMNEKISLKAKPFDTDAYSKILLKATNPKLINQMRKDSRSFAAKFPWGKVISEFESFINFAIEDSKKSKLKN